MINLAVVEGILAALLFGFILYAGSHPGTGLVPALSVGAVAAVAVPIGFFPSSRTIWLAIDLAMRPPEPEEIEGPAA